MLLRPPPSALVDYAHITYVCNCGRRESRACRAETKLRERSEHRPNGELWDEVRGSKARDARAALRRENRHV
jgi:hypothetical protein